MRGIPSNNSRVSRPRSLSRFVYQRILERIATGTLAPGERIVIDQVARELGTSLIPVREALARLNAEGLLEHQLNRGYTISPAPNSNDYRELFLTRVVIECGAVRHSAGNISQPIIGRLRDLNKKLRALKPVKTFRDYQRFTALNEEFHTELVALAQNKILKELYQKLAYGSRVTREQQRGVPDHAQIIREHAAIVESLEKRDVESTAVALEHHITAGMERFLRDLKQRESVKPAT